jgi:hypothetical protein
MRMTRIEEDQALLSERNLSSLAWQESNKALADRGARVLHLETAMRAAFGICMQEWRGSSKSKAIFV